MITNLHKRDNAVFNEGLADNIFARFQLRISIIFDLALLYVVFFNLTNGNLIRSAAKSILIIKIM